MIPRWRDFIFVFNHCINLVTLQKNSMVWASMVHRRKHRGFGIQRHCMLPARLTDHLITHDNPPNHLRTNQNHRTPFLDMHLNLHRTQERVSAPLARPKKRQVSAPQPPRMHRAIEQVAVVLQLQQLLSLLHLPPLRPRNNVLYRQLLPLESSELPTTIATVIVEETMVLPTPL